MSFVSVSRVMLVMVLAAVLLPEVGATASSDAASVAHHKTYFAQGADGSDLAYRAKVLQISGDGAILIKPAKWASWTSKVAKGHGTLRVDNCSPSCAQGHYSRSKVQITLYRARKKCGKWFFTRLTLVHTAKHYSGKRRSTQLVAPFECGVTSMVRDAHPLAGKTVGIDPGHNGHNYLHPEIINKQIWNGREYENCNTTGTATDGGYSEAKFNFRVATFLRKDLVAEGAHVVMTRHNNVGVGPCVNKRAEILNHAHADVGIDIHGDGGPASGRGFAVLEPVKDKENRHVLKTADQFGSILRRAVLAGTPMPTSTYDGVNGITHRDDLAGLNLTRVPLVLIECGNMRNATDARLMTSRHFQIKLAKAFAAAITTFVKRQH
jgi:N-acetylmuramoyl-L-alanine amidase